VHQWLPCPLAFCQLLQWKSQQEVSGGEDSDAECVSTLPAEWPKGGHHCVRCHSHAAFFASGSNKLSPSLTLPGTELLHSSLRFPRKLVPLLVGTSLIVKFPSQEKVPTLLCFHYFLDMGEFLLALFLKYRISDFVMRYNLLIERRS
jgi:hypothetical protein